VVNRNGASYRRVDNVNVGVNMTGGRRDTSPLAFRLNDDVMVQLKTYLAYRTTRMCHFEVWVILQSRKLMISVAIPPVIYKDYFSAK
jgi:hypothetical protein